MCPGCEVTLAGAAQLAVPLGLDECLAGFDYDAIRPLVTALKNGNRRDLVRWAADHLATLPAPLGATVTWAPTGSRRRRERGFDQAELLARAVARRWGAPCRPLLTRATQRAQAGRTAVERRSAPAFTTRRGVPASVVVVDDVATTGATLTAAARALRPAGATEVVGLVLARAR